MMKIVYIYIYIQFRDIPSLYEATDTPCVYRYFRVIRVVLWVSVGSSFFLSLSRRVILSQAAVVSKESLLPCVKHMSSATMTDVNVTSVLRCSKSVSVSKGTNGTDSSSFYISPLTKELGRLRNNREWTSKLQRGVVLFSNPFSVRFQLLS